jgi:hypothetical protein
MDLPLVLSLSLSLSLSVSQLLKKLLTFTTQLHLILSTVLYVKAIKILFTDCCLALQMALVKCTQNSYIQFLKGAKKRLVLPVNFFRKLDTRASWESVWQMETLVNILPP